MRDRFELETKINTILNTVDDLRLVAENLDNETIRGIANLLELKYELLFDCFCRAYKLDKYKE